MKKLLLLCLCMLLCLVGCGETPPPETTPPETSETSAATIITEELPPVVEPTLYHFSFIGAGDNMAYYGNVRDAKKNAEGTDLVYDFRGKDFFKECEYYIYFHESIDSGDLCGQQNVIRRSDPDACGSQCQA